MDEAQTQVPKCTYEMKKSIKTIKAILNDTRVSAAQKKALNFQLINMVQSNHIARRFKLVEKAIYLQKLS